MQRFVVVGAVGLVVAVATSCGSDDDASGDTLDPANDEEIYAADAVVIESTSSEPMLAFSVLDSDPPQGGDVPLTNWSWDDVDDEMSKAGTTWGGPYRVVGTWDGTSFALTTPPVTAKRGSEPSPFGEVTEGCDETRFLPVLDHVASLDTDALGIDTWFEDVFDGRCGAQVTALVMTEELRAGLEPFADQITVVTRFEPVSGE